MYEAENRLLGCIDLVAVGAITFYHNDCMTRSMLKRDAKRMYSACYG